MRILVVTVVHDPRDARIFHREIAALLTAGHTVTYAAPFTAYGAERPTTLRTIDLPRARGRRRLAALRNARATIRREAPGQDVVLLHDPELLAAAVGLHGPVVVWDVHEDTAAAVTLKPWLPRPLRAPVAAAVRRIEGVAEKRVRLLLAEDGYVQRFRGTHPVVPNSTPVPESVLPSGDVRVVYVGSITAARGVREMVELGRLLEDVSVTVDLVGPADAEATEVLREATTRGWVTWHGFLPNDEALAHVDGSLAGLSFLHDEPNYRHSKPTKVIEYMAHGVPVITTPIAPAVELVEGSGCGVVVPFPPATARAAAAAVRRLHADATVRQSQADRGRAAALRDHDWRLDGATFVRTLEQWSAEGRTRR